MILIERKTIRLCLMTAAIAAKPALAQDAQPVAEPPGSAMPDAASDAAGDLRLELDAMRARERESMARIQLLEQRLLAIESAAGLPGADMLGDDRQAELRGRGALPEVLRPLYRGDIVELQTTTPGSGPLAPAAATQPTDQTSERREPAPTEAVEAVTRDTQGYFGQRFTVEGGLTYSHFDDARINLSGFLALDAIFLGLISVDQQSSDILTTDLTARYAPSERLQLDVNLPYIYRSSTFQSGGAGGDASGLSQERVTHGGFGDLNAGLTYRLQQETVSNPDLVFNARIKAPTGRSPFGIELREVPNTEGNFEVPVTLSTGSGVWAASAGVSVLKTLDPMIVFGNMTYFYNLPTDFDDIDEAIGDQPGRVEIGNALQFGAGIAFALNERSSLSTSFSLRFGDETRVRYDGQAFRNIVGSSSTVGVLNLGATFAVSDNLSLLANVGVGMTNDAPDMTMSIRLPMRF